MNKLILVFIFTFTLCATALAQSNFTDNNFVITTYYPAPYGVYRNLRLQPSDEPTNGVAPGVMYFNQTNEQLYVYQNETTKWQPLGGGGGGYWTQSGNDIYNNNYNTGNVGIGTSTPPTTKLEVAGDIKVSGDVCNGAEKCLSSIYQTNVIAGTDPPCPNGQMAIMKAFNGTWYTADNLGIQHWNKVTCGAQLTADGSELIYNNPSHSAHTTQNCQDTVSLGVHGIVFPDGAGNNFCKFEGGSCPGGWQPYQYWSSALNNVTAYSPAGCGKPASYCSNTGGARGFMNSPVASVWSQVRETCSCSVSTDVLCDSETSGWHGYACYSTYSCLTGNSTGGASCPATVCGGSLPGCSAAGSATPPIAQVGCY